MDERVGVCDARVWGLWWVRVYITYLRVSIFRCIFMAWHGTVWCGVVTRALYIFFFIVIPCMQIDRQTDLRMYVWNDGYICVLGLGYAVEFGGSFHVVYLYVPKLPTYLPM